MLNVVNYVQQLVKALFKFKIDDNFLSAFQSLTLCTFVCFS